MASGTELVENISEQFLNCKLCSKTYKTPKSLSCTHTFCQCCLEKYYDAREDSSSRYQKHIKRSLACPMCYKRTEIPSGGIRQLPDSFLLTNLFAVLEKKKVDKDAIPPCSICKQPTRHNTKSAVSKCLECSKVLCRSCVKTHKATKVTQNHNLIDIETEKNITCKVHNDEPVRYYCEPCEVCICVLCTFEEHKNHEVITFSEGMTNQTSNLTSLLRECKVKTYKVKDRLEQLGNCEERIKEAEDLIRDTSYNMITAIRQRERMLLQKIKQFYGQEIFKFIEEKESMQENLKTLQNTCNITDTILKDPGIELLLIKKEMEGKLTTLVHEKLDKLPHKLYKKIKFVPGDSNLGFLEFNGMPPSTSDIIDDVGCHCSSCSVQREEKSTMTETENEEDDEKASMNKPEKRRICSSTSTESSDEESDESESEGSGSDSDDEMSDEASDLNNTDDQTFNYSVLISGSPDNSQSGPSNRNLVSVDCQTELHLLHDLLNESSGAFKVPQRQISDVSSSSEDMRCLIDTETTGASSAAGSENDFKFVDEVDAKKFIVDFESNISSVKDSLVDFENTISSGIKLTANSGTTMNSTMNPYVDCETSIGSSMLPYVDFGTTMEAIMTPMVEAGTTMQSQVTQKDAVTCTDKSQEKETEVSEGKYVCDSCKGDKPLVLSRETSPIRFSGKNRGTSPIRHLTKSKYTETNKIKTSEKGIQCVFVSQTKPLVKPPIPQKKDDLFIPDMKAKKPSSTKTIPKEPQNRPTTLFDLPPVISRPVQSKPPVATETIRKELSSPSKPEKEIKPMQTITESQDAFDITQYTIKLDHSPIRNQKDLSKAPEPNVPKLIPSLSFDSTSSDSERPQSISEKLDSSVSQKPKDSLARKQTLDLDQMLQSGTSSANKGATFPKSTPSTPKLKLKARVLARLGSVEDISKSGEKSQEGETIKTKLRKLIPERPHLPRIKGFKLKPPLADQKRHSISEPHPFMASKANKNM